MAPTTAPERAPASDAAFAGPATGRRFPTGQRFLDELYVHEHPVPADDWRQWAGSEDFLRGLRARLEVAGADSSTTERLIAEALADSGWRSLAALDAAARAMDAILRSGGLGRGAEATRVLDRLFAAARSGAQDAVPAAYWSVRPAPLDADGEEGLIMRGAILVHVFGRRAAEDAAAAGESAPLLPELAAALVEPDTRPSRELLRLLKTDGILAPAVLLVALALAAGGLVIEALLLRGLFDLGVDLSLSGQRLGAMVALIVLASALLMLELPIASGLFRIGRRLEIRLRAAFLAKIPLLGDRYFRSRLTSDMADRSHSVHRIRRLVPELGGELARSAFGVLLTTAGIAWLDSASAPWAVLAMLVSLALPLAAEPVLTERDLRVRTHAGALGRYYLDALFGVVAVRAHGVERSAAREHEGLLVDWVRAGRALHALGARDRGAAGFLAGFGLAAGCCTRIWAGPGTSGGGCCWCTGRSTCPCSARSWPSSPGNTPRIAT